ncbi:kinesin [Chloropicon primus]|uniref:Kinesin n=1 Tax=Chloropicon primus TaxID=1764295 RepID=A0A5B8MX81_9CHLO|nr:kinesin [Chloropicon primus]|eukprot:QDZ25117.1 kinesin [Chloropicon primus]
MTQHREKDENIKVLVRIRPPSEAEKASGGYRKAVFATEDGRGAFLASPGSQDNNKAVFSYDNVVDEETSQEKVFELVGRPIADAFLKGYHSNLLAYGQTGAGKTYTMQGATEDPHAADSKAQVGLLPRSLEYVFSSLEQKKQEHEEKSLNYTYGAQVSHLEIYNEVIFDLLDQNGGGKTITVREDGKRGVKVDGCSVEDVYDAAEAFNLFKSGCESRHVGQTAANRESSRSHSVFILTVTQKFTDAETGLEKRLKASFYLVDLAGSERQKHSEAVGQTLKEACGINKSLSTLGNVIKSLVDIADGKERHIPYRDSKLTFLLKNSFGGMSKCSFVANVSPSIAALEETLSTLKFAQRAKTVKNTSSVCEETIGSVVALQAELKKVKAELLSLQSDQGMSQMSLGSVVQNLDEESSKHLEKVRQLLTYERESHASEKEKLFEQVESLQGLAKKLETSLKSTKLVVRLRQQNLERLQSKLPPAPEAFWGEQGGAAIKENEQLKVQLECHPEVVKCRMEIESLQKENTKLKKKLETDVESQIFVFEENAKTAMEELHFLLRDRENLQTSHQDLNKQFNQLKEENFIDLQNAHEKLESVYNTNVSLQEANDLMELECTELKAKITSLESTVKSASIVIEKTQSAFEQVQADLLAHTEMYDQLNDQVQTITNAYELLQEQKETVEASFESFKSEVDAQKQAHAVECGQLNDQIKTIQEQKEAVEASFESFKSEVDAQKQAHAVECGQLNDQIKTIQEQKETVEASFESFKSEVDAQKQAHAVECGQLNDQIKTIQEQKETVEASFESFKSEVDAQKQAHAVECGQLNDQIKTIQEQKEAVEASFESFKSEVDAQKQAHAVECGQLNDQIKTIQEQKETVEASFESFKSEVDAQKQAHAVECGQLNDQIKTIQEQKETVEASFESFKSEVDAQKQAHAVECGQLNDQIKTIQEQKETVEASFESFKSEVDAQKQAHAVECGQLNDQIKTIQEQKETVEASFESFKSEVDAQKQAHAVECGQLNDQIKTIQEQKETVEASFESFKSEMDAQKQAHTAQLLAEKEAFENEMTMLKESHEAEMDAATAKISELQALVEDLEMKAASIESEENAYLGKLEVLENQLIEKQELLTGAEESKKETESDRDQLAQAVTELERTCEELQNEVSTIRAANSEFMEDLKSKLSATTTKYEEAVHENDRANAVADSLTSELAEVKQGRVELEKSLKAKITDLEHGLERASAEKSEAEKALEEAKEELSANDNNASVAEAQKAKIRNLENALKKAQEAEAELKMKSRESLSSCNTALEEVEKLNSESQAMKAAEEDLRAQIASTNDELGRFKQLYTESQGERKALEKEKESLLSQIDSEAEKRQAAIMTKVQSESKLSQVREEVLELRNDLESQLKSEKMVSDQLRKKVRQLELDAARSQSPSTPPNDENVLRSSSFKMGSAHRKPFGEISNKIKSIELTPTRQEGKSKAADKSKQLNQVKAHLSAIENAITSRNSSRYALRTRNRVTYKE